MSEYRVLPNKTLTTLKKGFVCNKDGYDAMSRQRQNNVVDVNTCLPCL